MTDDKPFEVLSPTKIRLGLAALEQLGEYQAAGYFPPGKKGREEFGKYLIRQHYRGDQASGEDSLPDVDAFALGGNVAAKTTPGTPAYDPTSPITEDEFFG